MEHLIYHFMVPKRLSGLGAAFMGFSGLQLFAALVFRAIDIVLASSRAVAPGGTLPTTAAEFLPAVPTFWIPETTAGLIFAGVLLGVGFCALVQGRVIDERLRRL